MSQPEFKHLPGQERFARGRKNAKLVRISAGALFGSFLVLEFTDLIAFNTRAYFPQAPPEENILRSIASVAIVVSVLTLVVSALGTASAVMLGWRADRRQSEELRLKIQQMELQIAELRKNSSAEK